MYISSSARAVFVLCAVATGICSSEAAVLDRSTQAPVLPVTREVIKPGAAHEACFRLEAGDQVTYQFESTKALSFNIRYHEGDKVREPAKLANALYGSNSYRAAVAQAYCLMWNNAGETDAKLQYGFRIEGKSLDTLR
jgi:hypothetical protein